LRFSAQVNENRNIVQTLIDKKSAAYLLLTLVAKIAQNWTRLDKMNLSVKDVAGLLNVSEKTIYRMIQQEMIPCFRVGGQWRFDRREISSWIEDTRTFSYETATNKYAEDEESISLSGFLQKGGIYSSIQGDTKETVILSCLECIRTKISQIDTAKIFSSIMDREALCATAVGQGIALPHPKAFGKFTVSSYIALCKLERPVPFEALDKEDVDTLFFIFPKSERRFLRIQSKLLRLLKDDEVISTIRDIQSTGDKHAEEIYRVLARKEAEILGVVDK
jgi:nitrogen PTS system EIIA component